MYLQDTAMPSQQLVIAIALDFLRMYKLAISIIDSKPAQVTTVSQKTAFYPPAQVRHSPSPPLSLPLPIPFPLEVRSLTAARGVGSAVSSPSGVWGKAPAKIEFGAFKP